MPCLDNPKHHYKDTHFSQKSILWWQSRSSSLLIFIQKRQTAEGWGRRGGGSSRSATEITERVKRLWEPLYPFSSHDSDCDSWNASGSRSTATNRTPGARCKIVLEWPPPPKVMSITVCRSKGGKTERVQQQFKMEGVVRSRPKLCLTNLIFETNAPSQI